MDDTLQFSAKLLKQLWFKFYRSKLLRDASAEKIKYECSIKCMKRSTFSLL